MFNRHQPRFIGVELPQLEEDSDLARTIEVVQETNRRRAKKWRDRGNIGRKTQQVENTFNGTTVRRAADKVKPYIGHEDILLREKELYLPAEDDMEQEEENDQLRQRRERRLSLRYRDDDEPGMAIGNRPEDEVEQEENSDPEGEGEEDVVRYRRERRPVRRYVEC
ncbi:hypothetical protein E2C01_063567 [Portunus trituberculatus]|uniref:Uncharacterized protein n=1 Tax=Portunus trituberculatus TaxID=210409 RepID=A0A5B7HL84_PORTR|nr:hypothetical protein [Portunus trituberculatus]